MSRLFDNGASDTLLNATTPLSATQDELTIAAWVMPDEAIVEIAAASVDSGATQVFHSVGLSNTHQAQAISRSGGTIGTSTTAGAITINTWGHIASVVTPLGGSPGTSTARQAFLNGTAGTANTTDVAVASQDNISVGFRNNSTPTGFFSGRIAEVAFWSVALTDAEIAILALGYSPLFVRPASLVFYAPLVRDLQDIRGGRTLTASGTAVADHPRIIYPWTRTVGVPTAAAPGGFIPFPRREMSGGHLFLGGGITG